MADPRAQEVVRAVGGDAVDPAPELRPLLEAGQLAIGLQEGLLHHILRVVLVARHAEGQPEDAAAVPLHQEAKGLGIAAPRTGDGLDLVFASHHPLR